MKYIGAVRMAAMSDAIVTHEPFLRDSREDYGPDVLYRTLGGQFVLGHHYSKAMKAQRLIQEDYARVLQGLTSSSLRPRRWSPRGSTPPTSNTTGRRTGYAGRGRVWYPETPAPSTPPDTRR